MIAMVNVVPAGIPIAVPAEDRAGIQMIETGSRLRLHLNAMASILAAVAARGGIAPNSNAPIVTRVYSSALSRSEADVMTVTAVLEDRHAEIESLDFSIKKSSDLRGFFILRVSELNALLLHF